MLWSEIKNRVNSVGMWFDAGGIGDRIQFTSIPENFYKNTGLKLAMPILVDCFRLNPFIEFTSIEPDLVLDPWFGHLHFPKTKESIKVTFPQYTNRSLAEKHLFFNDFKLYLNRPRLYVYEDLKVLNLLLIHRTGKTVGELEDSAVDFVVQRYKAKGYNIGQIGGIKDKAIPDVLDFRGRDLFETAELLAQASVFVGLNSGMYHLASCYNVQKKVILNNYWNDGQLENFFPLSYATNIDNCPPDIFPQNSIWLDFNAEYYNLSDHDIGVTRSINHI